MILRSSRFIDHGAGSIPGFNPAVKFFEICAITSFIAHGPQDDAGLVLIPFHHAPAPVHPLPGPGGIIGNKPILLGVETHAVGLNIGLVNHIEPILIAKLIPTLLIRVVGGAHCIDVVFLHQFYIPDHRFPGDGPAPYRIPLVAVHPADLDRLAIDPQVPILNFYPPEPHLLAEAFQHVSLGAGEGQLQTVKDRCFRGPGFYPAYVGFESDCFYRINGCLFLQVQKSPPAFFKLDLYAVFPGIPLPVQKIHIQVQGAAAVAVIQVCLHKKISDAYLGRRVEIDIPFQPADPPGILTFQIGTVGKTVDLDRYFIPAPDYMPGDIKFCRCLGALAVTHQDTIDPQVKCGAYTAKADENIPVKPVFIAVKIPDIAAHCIVLVGHEGRIGRKGIFLI